MQHSSDVELDAWSRLWRSGVLHSCASGITGNYDQEFSRFWTGAFLHLRPRDIMVDLGTGNGAIPLLARAYANANGFDLNLHGVDVADIDPARSVPNGSLLHADTIFHPRTSMTALPFDDGEVALVCAQYAFEYAPREAAARELLRVIGSQGRAALVLHSEDSIIAETTRHQLRAIQWLLHETPILEATSRLLNATAGATTPEKRKVLAANPAAEACRHSFNEAASALMDEIEARTEAPILQAVATEISRQIRDIPATADEAASRSRALRHWVEDERHRLTSMQTACLDAHQLAELAQLLSASGRTVVTGQLAYETRIPMAWTIVVGDE
jgi:hypothetical protein